MCLSQTILLVPPLAGYQYDYVFDWTILKYQQTQMARPPPPVGESSGVNPDARISQGGAGPSGASRALFSLPLKSTFNCWGVS